MLKACGSLTGRLLRHGKDGFFRNGQVEDVF